MSGAARDRHEPGGPARRLQHCAPPLALLAGLERLPQRPLVAEQLGAEQALDRLAAGAHRGALAQQRVEHVRRVADPEPLVERHADPAQRAEGDVHRGEGLLLVGARAASGGGLGERLAHGVSAS
ncbi:MAG: hypothetical protein QM767_27000 [Anaeromyxobacter sp.]